MPGERKKILLRLDPAVHDALARWAGEDLRSTNAQIEFLLRQSLAAAGRLPGNVGRIRPRGRPRRDEPDEPTADEAAPDGTAPDETTADDAGGDAEPDASRGNGSGDG